MEMMVVVAGAGIEDTERLEPDRQQLVVERVYAGGCGRCVSERC